MKVCQEYFFLPAGAWKLETLQVLLGGTVLYTATSYFCCYLYGFKLITSLCWSLKLVAPKESFWECFNGCSGELPCITLECLVCLASPIHNFSFWLPPCPLKLGYVYLPSTLSFFHSSAFLFSRMLPLCALEFYHKFSELSWNSSNSFLKSVAMMFYKT